MRLMICPRLLRSILLLGALVWLATAPAGTARASGTWQVVLGAGDDAEPVFDNATRELGRRLATAGVPPGNIHRLSASFEIVQGTDASRATPPTLNSTRSRPLPTASGQCSFGSVAWQKNWQR